ncbi:MAG: hypothetical protein K2M51_04930 [Helicobacter sp.]|nr:hypothetical protein [Helicobacter sp.]
MPLDCFGQALAMTRKAHAKISIVMLSEAKHLIIACKHGIDEHRIQKRNKNCLKVCKKKGRGEPPIQGTSMLITTNTNAYSPTIVKPQVQKTEETREFASRLSTDKVAESATIQKQTREFPKGLLQDIENLSSFMLDIDIGTTIGKARGDVYFDNNGNVSFVLGGYEYVVSKTDENLNLNDLKNIESSSTHLNWTTKDNIQDSKWLGDDIYLFYINDDFDKTRYRPFSPHRIFYDEVTGKSFSPEPEAFPEELNRQPDMGYMYADFESNLRIIEKLVDKQLLAEYEKDPRSDETQQLLFLKAKINTISEMIEKDREIVAEYLQLDDTLFTAIFTHRDLWANQTAMLAEFGLNLNKFLSEEEQQQVIDSLNVILNYSDHHWFEGFGAEISSLFKQDIAAAQLKESSKDFQESLISRLSAIDNTEILLNLVNFVSSSDVLANIKASKSYESLIDKIRSKLKTTDDSILQQVMSKITNGVKANGIGEGA